MKAAKKKNNLFVIILAIILTAYVLSLVVPVLWGIFTSLKTSDNYDDNILGLPGGAPWNWAWNNYGYVIKNFETTVTNGKGQMFNVPFGDLMVNTLLYAGIGGLLITLTPFTVAYMTSRFDYFFSKIVYGIVLVTMALPIIGSYPSEIQMLKTLGLYDKIYGTWIQKINFLGVYYLLFYGIFKGMDKAFWEAAYIDGASEFTVMTRIIMPLAKNAFFTVFLIKFIELWNDYQNVYLYIPGHPTLAYGIYSFRTTTDYRLKSVPVQLSGCVLMVVPIVVLFLVFKDKLIGNLSAGGVKG